jgi:hypothetical protein
MAEPAKILQEITGKLTGRKKTFTFFKKSMCVEGRGLLIL